MKKLTIDYMIRFNAPAQNWLAYLEWRKWWYNKILEVQGT